MSPHHQHHVFPLTTRATQIALRIAGYVSAAPLTGKPEAKCNSGMKLTAALGSQGVDCSRHANPQNLKITTFGRAYSIGE